MSNLVLALFWAMIAIVDNVEFSKGMIPLRNYNLIAFLLVFNYLALYLKDKEIERERRKRHDAEWR